MAPTPHISRLCLLVLLALPLTSVAESPALFIEEEEPKNIDPWEPMNRKIFAFNETLDRWVLRPVASGYHNVTPDPVERGVANFIDNIYEFNFMFNGLLQGRPDVAATAIGRFMVNTTIGVFGFLDVASRMGIEQQKADFGQTLMTWGVPPGPYVMLPIFGPRTLRSATGYFVDTYTSIPVLAWDTEEAYLFWTVEAISYRAGLLEYDDLVTGDRYVFFRSAYLQQREAFLNGGEAPVDDFSDSEEYDDWEEDF